MASLSSDSASTVDNNTIGKEKSQEVYNEILRKAKNNSTKTNAFAEAVRRSGLDFDDAVMAETRAEAESRQAAQYRAERRGTAAQTGVDKAVCEACRQAWWSRS